MRYHNCEERIPQGDCANPATYQDPRGHWWCIIHRVYDATHYRDLTENIRRWDVV